MMEMEDGLFWFVDPSETSPKNTILALKNSADKDAITFQKAVIDQGRQLPDVGRRLMLADYDFSVDDLHFACDEFLKKKGSTAEQRDLGPLLENFFNSVATLSRTFTPREIYIVGKVSNGLYEAAWYKPELRADFGTGDVMKPEEIGAHFLLHSTETNFTSKGRASIPCEYSRKISVKLSNGFEQEFWLYEERDGAWPEFQTAFEAYSTCVSNLESAIRSDSMNKHDIADVFNKLNAFIENGPSNGTANLVVPVDVDVPPRMLYCSQLINFCVIKWVLSQTALTVPPK